MAAKKDGSRDERRPRHGAGVRRTSDRQPLKDYREAEVKTVMARGDWKSWNDIIQWLDQRNENDNLLSRGEAMAMKEDLQMLTSRGIEFTRDPSRAFQVMHQFRK